MIAGFGWGGWITDGTSKTRTEDAVLVGHAEICIAQFMKQPNHEEQLQEFDKVSRWERYKFVGKGGWNMMPGQKEDGYGGTQACSDRLELLV